MTQIAIFSDIHANLPALETVLQDINRRNIHQSYCLGDLVDFAPWGNEVIELFKTTHIPCLMGNHDERIAFDLPITPLAHHDSKETQNRLLAINHSKATITPENKRWLSQLPQQIELIFKTQKILLVHGSPASNDEYIFESHPIPNLLQLLKNRHSNALIMGHTHLSYIRHSNTLFVNCGSVGRTKEADRKATYCILTITEEAINPEIIKLDYPIDYVAQNIYQSPIPDFYADFLLNK
ncbi:MAG: metallophosphoesterase family protein [Bacteroidetes bacterium]|nr:metallophosphoesterase family protein [Bacteroidota bacterium]